MKTYAQIVVSPEVHKRLRIETAYRERSITELVETAIDFYLLSHPMKKGAA
jgi:hypothetical protein